MSQADFWGTAAQGSNHRAGNGSGGRLFDSQNFLACVGGERSVFEYGAQDVVYRQGEPADAVYYVLSGKAKVTVKSEQGREAVIAILGPGDFLGEGCLGRQRIRLATVIALVHSRIARVPKTEIVGIIQTDAAFGEFLILRLLARNTRMEADLADQIFNSSEKRLARTLLLLANFGTEGEPEPILAKISQETLAEMVGTTRSRVSHFMNKFRKLGFIDYNGHIEVHRSLLSVVLLESPDSKSED
jgi:CRP/FNR family cyclic AMP-dependent transcriptional regulator